MLIIIAIAIATSLSTLFGGLLALRLRDKLHLVLGFSAGAVIGVAFFDLLPEALNLAGTHYALSTVTSVVVLGFSIFMVLDRLFSLHAHHEDNCHNLNHSGKLGAGSLSIHSFLDGLAIGLAFHVSMAVGAVVATAVLVHDFSDGINTVGLILKNQGNRQEAFKWLILDSIAPLLGVISTFFFRLPATTLGLVLAMFSGFFIYIGASDLLPESHHEHPYFLTTVMTVVGILVLYFAVRLAGI
jgi:ZIP family zinc transporter